MPRIIGARFLAETMNAYGVIRAFYIPLIVTWALVDMEKVGGGETQ